uniref:Transposase MuDR plant domain-containing protein n=2 Tax=Oryza sativa subsp. japonica TaxID=39947 RepID=Q10GT2_ORYSJ|nr:hypothetical protein [Oryza sativa Japonica Group]ABF97619.1 hypothetical protein LOC_Os03g41850 [Oryza sativa Japonica Group]
MDMLDTLAGWRHEMRMHMVYEILTRYVLPRLADNKYSKQYKDFIVASRLIVHIHAKKELDSKLKKRGSHKENEVIQEAIYTRAEDMKEAVKHFAVSLHREFWVAKFNWSQYEVRCVKEKDGCPWRVHVYKGKLEGLLDSVSGTTKEMSIQRMGRHQKRMGRHQKGSTPPSRVVQLELPEEYRVTKGWFERGEGSSRRG